MGFRLVPKSVTLNNLKQRNDRYVVLSYCIRQLWGQSHKSA